VNIPVPKIEIVEDYEQNVPPNFNLKQSYYRLIKPTREKIDSVVDYTADLEDEQFVAEQQHLIRKNTNLFCYYNSNNNLKKMMSTTKQQKDNSTNQSNTIQTTQIHLTIHLFEQMIDILEKATAFETIVRLDQAEKLFHEKIVSFPPPSNIGAAAGDTSTTTTCPDLMVERVYNYWVQKRCKLKKPLLRNYWPVTSIHDTNPHMVFRPREKEKYKLRKKRQNDKDAFQG
jgi:enhancer of polycomb-like protein